MKELLMVMWAEKGVRLMVKFNLESFTIFIPVLKVPLAAIVNPVTWDIFFKYCSVYRCCLFVGRASGFSIIFAIRLMIEYGWLGD